MTYDNIFYDDFYNYDDEDDDIKRQGETSQKLDRATKLHRQSNKLNKYTKQIGKQTDKLT